MLRIISILVLAYLALCLLLYFFQRSYIYYPTPESSYDGFFFLENQGEKIKIWSRNTQRPRAIIYFGGNAEAVEYNLELFSGLFPGHAIYLMAYRGYGGSSGKPSQQGLFSDAQALYRRISQDHESIRVMGRSLGSGVAVFLAASEAVDKLVLITPFDSMVNVAGTHYPVFPVSVLLKDKYPSVDYAEEVSAATLILIGDQDRIIPKQHGLDLAAAFQPEQVRVEVLEGRGHNDINMHPGYFPLIQNFLGEGRAVELSAPGE